MCPYTQYSDRQTISENQVCFDTILPFCCGVEVIRQQGRYQAFNESKHDLDNAGQRPIRLIRQWQVGQDISWRAELATGETGDINYPGVNPP